MHRKVRFISMLVGILLFSVTMGNTKHVIGCWDAPNPEIAHCTKPGFFSAVIAVLNNINWCVYNGKTPVVYWDNISLYYTPEGLYNETKNVWEYYFEPVSSERYDPATDTIFRSYASPNNKGIVPFKTPSDRAKRLLNDVIKKFIRIRPEIQQKIDTFYEKNIASVMTIGIHLRGTDKSIEVEMPNPRTILDRANAWAALQTVPVQFFVATDEERLLTLAKDMLNGPVISYDSYRSPNKNPIHFKNTTYNAAQQGEEVLIETVLLSRCNVFFYSHSNLAYMVSFLDPDLETHFVEEKKYIIGYLAGRNSKGEYVLKTGLCSALLAVIAHLQWCERNDKTPVIHWDNLSPYYDPRTYGAGENVWNYYFEPISSEVYREEDVAHIGINDLDDKEVDRASINDTAYRAEINAVMQRYLHIKPEVLAPINIFYNKHMSKHRIIGVHLRGTDKLEEGYVAQPDLIIAAANREAEKRGINRFFVATDDFDLLQQAVRDLKGTVIAANACRSLNHRPIHRVVTSCPASEHGAQVLQDIVLLSRCEHLVCSHSNVAYITLFYNPALSATMVGKLRG